MAVWLLSRSASGRMHERHGKDFRSSPRRLRSGMESLFFKPHRRRLAGMPRSRSLDGGEVSPVRSRRAHAAGLAEAADRIFKTKCDDRVVFDDQDVIRQAFAHDSIR